MRKGSIVLVPFPFTDLSGKKVRPAVVLHAGAGDDFIAVFISSVTKARKASNSVTILMTESNGLKVPSYIRVSKIATLQKSIVIGELGNVEPQILKSVDGELKKLLNL